MYSLVASPRPGRSALACAIGLTLTSGWAHAQSQPPTEPASPASATTLPAVVVTANPLRNTEMAAPVSVLAGDALVLRRGSSLGETLGGLPGVSSTYFGPNASRPVIRGLDGERVKVLSNAGSSLDASTLSFDHAVPIDPLIVDRIEVLRGPGALFYGGTAVGGVVNALDNRIPQEPQQGVSGSAEARLGGAARERGGAAVVEAGDGRLVVHADAFGRDTSDLHVPKHTPLEDGSPLPETRRVRNSASETRGGALGGSLFFDRGRIGASADTYDSRYGAVAEPDVSIRMKRDHVGLSGEFKNPHGPLRSLNARFDSTRYTHQEIEGDGAVGTTFRTSGEELRIEAGHAPLGPLRGTVGLQLEDVDFSALGEEAFVPSTRTRRQALFVLEEMPWAGGTFSAGARVERAHVASAGDADPAAPKFGAPAERRFSLRSASLSNLYKLTPRWSLSGALSYTERAPTSFELFANGVHAATGSFERGDTGLGTERGTNLDVSAAWTDGHDHLRVGAFSTRFSRFISLDATGGTVDLTENGVTESFTEYVFRPVRARLNGIEVEGKHRMATRPSWSLDLSGKLDLTRGTNLDTGEALPRVAPLRASLALDLTAGLWGGRVEADHSARQSRVPSTDTPTDAFTVVNLSLTRRFAVNSHSDALWFLKLTNLGDTLGYSASSVQTVRDLSPLPGRAVKTGVRVNF
jgi:iron complex outermembrane receptor protein